MTCDQAIGLLLLLPLAVSAELIKVDSRIQGRSFVVDTDRPEIRKSLRDVAAAPAASTIPEWLPPYPGAVRITRPGDAKFASYRTSALADDVFAHYESAVRAAGVTVTYINRLTGRGGQMHLDDGSRTVVVSVSPGVGPTDIGVNWNPKKTVAPVGAGARLEAAWYDDTTDILRLRDPDTGKEYELDGAAMLNYARSTPLASAARIDFPAWVVAYPGAKIRVAAAPPAGWRPEKFIDMKSYMIEADTAAAVAAVAEFYRDTMTRNGLRIERETQSPPRAYSLEARNPERTHQLFLEVQRQGTSTFVRVLDHYTTPRP